MYSFFAKEKSLWELLVYIFFSFFFFFFFLFWALYLRSPGMFSNPLIVLAAYIERFTDFSTFYRKVNSRREQNILVVNLPSANVKSLMAFSPAFLWSEVLPNSVSPIVPWYPLCFLGRSPPRILSGLHILFCWDRCFFMFNLPHTQ